MEKINEHVSLRSASAYHPGRPAHVEYGRQRRHPRHLGTGLQEDLPYLGYLWVLTGTLLAAAPIALTAALIKAKELSQ